MKLFLALPLFVLTVSPAKIWASDSDQRKTVCYELSESENFDSPVYVLCQHSADLEKFPKAIVTFVLKQGEQKRGLASADQPAAAVNAPKHRALAKTHYVQLAPGQFGRHSGRNKGKPMIVFNEDSKTVSLGFLKQSQDHAYHYKEMPEDLR
jgi:hypothetical protein